MMTSMIKDSMKELQRTVTQNPAIKLKLKECSKILSRVVFYKENRFDFQHSNLLIVCLESLALQDDFLKIKIDNRTLGDTEKKDHLTNLGYWLIGKKTYDSVKKFRTALFHGGKDFTEDDFLQFCKITKTKEQITNFFAKLVKLIQCACDRIEALEQLQGIDYRYRKVNLSLFAKESEIQNFGKPFNFNNQGTILDLFEKMMPSSRSAKTTRKMETEGKLETEELLYDFTVRIYSMFTARIGKQKTKKCELLKHIWKERGDYIHQFYKSIDENEIYVLDKRYLLLFKFHRTWASQIYKFFLAIKVQEILCLDASGLKNSDLANTLKESNEKLKQQPQISFFETYSNLSSRDQLETIVTGYIKLIVPIDDIESTKKREIHYVHLTASDKREIYEKFLIMKSLRSKRNMTDYIAESNALKGSLFTKGIETDTFDSLVYAFIESPDDLDDETKTLRNNLVTHIQHFCAEPGVISKVPLHRRFSEQKVVGAHIVENIDKTMLEMFCGKMVSWTGFKDVEEVFGDYVFLEHLLFLFEVWPTKLKACRIPKLVSATTAQNEDKTPYIASLLAQLITKKNLHTKLLGSNITEIVRCLVQYVDKPVYVECLRSLLHFYTHHKLVPMTQGKVPVEIELLRPLEKLERSDQTETYHPDQECMWTLLKKHNTGQQGLKEPIANSTYVFNYKNGKKKPTYEAIVRDIFGNIDVGDSRYLSLTGLFHINVKEGIFFDHVCLDNILQYLKTLDDTDKNRKFIKVFFRLIQEVATELYRQGYPTNNGLALLKRFCSDGNDSELLLKLDKLSRMELLNLRATIHCKVGKAERRKRWEGKPANNASTTINREDVESIRSISKVVRDFVNTRISKRSIDRSNLSMLYDAAFQASYLEKDRQTAYTTYTELYNSILRLLNCPIVHVHPLTSELFNSIFSTLSYTQILSDGKHGDLLNIEKCMAYELQQSAIASCRAQPTQTRNVRAAQASSELYQNAICHYKRAWEFKNDVTPSKGYRSTDVLVPLASTYFMYTKYLHWLLGNQETLRCMKEGLRFTKLALDISKQKFTKHHAFVIRNRIDYGERNYLVAQREHDKYKQLEHYKLAQHHYESALESNRREQYGADTGSFVDVRLKKVDDTWLTKIIEIIKQLESL